MEDFKTKLDDIKLSVTVQVFSDALLDGSNKIFISIYHKDAPRKWRKMDANQKQPNVFTSQIDKSRVLKRPILKIRTNFIVDDISLKESIAKVSTVKYKIEDTLNNADYVSKFEVNEEEYDLGKSDDETFSIAKKVNVIFT